MEYKILPFEENESRLFYGMDGEVCERHGMIGYMRADFGKNGNEFWHNWFNYQNHLNTPAFKAEFGSIIDYLRDGMQYPVFSNRRDLEAFCLHKTPCFVLNTAGQRINNLDTGFKIQTTDYTYFARCRPAAGHYDIYLFAYDNRYLLPELAGQHELPQMCYSIKPHSGEIAVIKNGEKGYFHCEYSTTDPEHNRKTVEMLNNRMGVTKAQEEAMLGGSICGWNTDMAKPWKYDSKGDLRLPPTKKKEEYER